MCSFVLQGYHKQQSTSIVIKEICVGWFEMSGLLSKEGKNTVHIKSKW